MAVYQEARDLWDQTGAAGPLTEGAAGIAAISLSLIGIVSVTPGLLPAIATIVIALGLMVEGANAAIAYSETMMRAEAGAPEVAELGADITCEFMAGACGIVLG